MRGRFIPAPSNALGASRVSSFAAARRLRCPRNRCRRAFAVVIADDEALCFHLLDGPRLNPAIEADALSVASYGKQLGRIGEALIVLLKHLDLGKLSHDETRAIGDLKSMLNEIANKKVNHGAKLVLRP